MAPQNLPDLQIPHSKPEHAGYCLSCYRPEGVVFSIPMDASTSSLSEILGRSSPINGEPLSKAEFVTVFTFVIGAIELCWHDDLEFLIEGMNLPLAW